MSDTNEQEQRQLEKLQRRWERIKQRDAQYQERSAAAEHLWKLLHTWAGEAECSERTFNRVKKYVLQLIQEAHQGKVENLDERFAQAVQRAIAETLPKKRLTYLKLSKALQEIVELNTQWSRTAAHSRKEQDHMLRGLRLLLLEIEAGYTEHLPERFQQIISSPNQEE